MCPESAAESVPRAGTHLEPCAGLLPLLSCAAGTLLALAACLGGLLLPSCRHMIPLLLADTSDQTPAVVQATCLPCMQRLSLQLLDEHR